MSEILIIGDTHFGVKNDSQIMLTHQDEFFKGLFEYCKANKVSTIIQTGDVFDRRKFSNNRTVYECKRIFLDRAKELNINVIMLVGNHDIFYRNTILINSPRLYLSEYKNLTIVDKPTSITLNDSTFLFVPWICQENKDVCMEAIITSNADYCVGHFDIVGFEMFLGQVSHEGLDENVFAKFKHVYSGHYHHKSTRGNITFVGTPYQLTWNDYGDSKGVFSFDGNNHKFIENKSDIYVKIYYDESKPNEIPDNLVNKFVKVIVTNKKDLYKFDQFIQKISKQQPYDIKIAEDIMILTDQEMDEEISIDDTPSILNNFIDKLDLPVDDKTASKQFLLQLYIEALNAE
jgi:DNA repair exonuclease SbcCD nuclease subunit